MRNVFMSVIETLQGEQYGTVLEPFHVANEEDWYMWTGNFYKSEKEFLEDTGTEINPLVYTMPSNDIWYQIIIFENVVNLVVADYDEENELYDKFEELFLGGGYQFVTNGFEQGCMIGRKLINQMRIASDPESLTDYCEKEGFITEAIA